MTYATEVLADAPLVYLRLGDASGTTATDSSGNGRNGTYSGSPTLGTTGLLTGDSDTAVTFDGINDYITLADTTDLTSFTVEALIKTSTTSATIAARADGAGTDRIFFFQISSSNIRGVVRNAAGTTGVATGTGVADNARHHVVLAYDGSTIRVYCDGTQVGTASLAGPLSTVDRMFEVGAFATDTGGSGYFSGVLDEVAYYSTALSAARVLAHYNAAIVAPPVVPDFLASSAVAYGPTLLTGVTVTPAFLASGAQVFSPTLNASIAVTPGPLAASSTFFGPHLIPKDQTGDPQIGPGGWLRDNVGEGSWLPDVAPPTVAIFPQNRVIAQAFPAPAVTGTHAIVEPTYVAEDAHLDRIIVGGVDITYWRGIPTPTPDWQVIKPLGWAAGTLRIPQAAMPFETPGQGDLSWCPPGAPVLVQRIDPDTGAVIRTDYRGIVVTYDIQGGDLVLELGGHGVGRASLLNRQAQLIQRRRPAGWAVAWAIRYMGLRHEPALGTDTGIRLIDWGGGGLLDYFNELISKMTTVDGDQWTTMPDDDGVYRTTLVDTTTIHGTIYLDDARNRPDLRRDISEEPNRIFASGVAPNGMVIKFGAYPGLIQGEAAPYPFNDGRTFGPGTTDATTDTGDGITVMGSQLFTMGYVAERAGAPGYNNYDAEYVAGIKDLQKDAGLTRTGNMTPAAWAALYNQNVTGYTLRNIRVLPAAEDLRVKPWLLSSDGSIIGANPDFDPSVLPVERNIAMGAGFTRDQIRRWSQQQIDPAAQWRGTITLTTGAVIAGDHFPGDPITAIRRTRDIRPGENYRIPQFGGIVVHVSAVSVRDQGQTVELVVATKPGDTLPVWAAIQRDRDSRNTVHRSFFAQRKAATLDRENTFDEVGGVVSPVKLNPGGWTVFPVVAKQAGTIEKIRLRLTDEREFVTAVFGRRISAARLRAVTNAPLTKAGTKRWTNETVLDNLDHDHVLLYVAGSNDDPCGYAPGRKSEDDPLTGRHIDDASFPFVTFVNDSDRGSVLWVAIWVQGGGPVKLQGGRIMWPSAEDY